MFTSSQPLMRYSSNLKKKGLFFLLIYAFIDQNILGGWGGGAPVLKKKKKKIQHQSHIINTQYSTTATEVLVIIFSRSLKESKCGSVAVSPRGPLWTPVRCLSPRRYTSLSFNNNFAILFSFQIDPKVAFPRRAQPKVRINWSLSPLKENDYVSCH